MTARIAKPVTAIEMEGVAGVAIRAVTRRTPAALHQQLPFSAASLIWSRHASCSVVLKYPSSASAPTPLTGPNRLSHARLESGQRMINGSPLMLKSPTTKTCSSG